MPLDITGNRSASKYSRKEIFMRVLWGFGKIIFRLTPRPCFRFRAWLLRMYGARLGRNFRTYASTHIYYPWNLNVGDDTSLGEWALVYNLGLISIGSRTTVSQRVHLCAGTHDYRDAAMPLLKPPISVGDEVWICADAFVGPNVRIADRAIIGGASAVFSDVAESAIVGGNPAQILKMRDTLSRKEID